MRNRSGIVVVLALSLLGFTCDGVDTGGIGGSGFTSGSISSFGSIFVNGVEWELDDADIEIDGSLATEDDLELGMVVQVTGTIDSTGISGSADTVVVDTDFEAPVTGVTVVSADEVHLEVLGTTVVVDRDLTHVYGQEPGFGIDDLAVGDFVRVAGFFVDPQVIEATYIERTGDFDAGDRIEVEGVVANFDPEGSFRLGALVVHFDQETIWGDLTPEEIANGTRVEVEGVLDETGELFAGKVEPAAGDELGDFESVEVEGFVSDFVDLSSFRVGQYRVDASAAVFESGDPNSLANGAFVEVEGSSSDGTLTVDTIKIEWEE